MYKLSKEIFPKSKVTGKEENDGANMSNQIIGPSAYRLVAKRAKVMDF
jgi:hypothetical protein